MTDVYHTGFLAVDRERPAGHRLRGRDCFCDLCLRAIEVGHAGDAAWRAYQSGYVTLVQRRVEPGVYQYIARPRAR